MPFADVAFGRWPRRILGILGVTGRSADRLGDGLLLGLRLGRAAASLRGGVLGGDLDLGEAKAEMPRSAKSASFRACAECLAIVYLEFP